jgi:hypothetical protein
MKSTRTTRLIQGGSHQRVIHQITGHGSRIELVKERFVTFNRQIGIGLGIIRGAIDDIQASDRSLLDSNRYLSYRADELMKELTLLQAETEVLGCTPFDPVPEYSRAVMRLRLKSAELASLAAHSALLHVGAKGFIVSSATPHSGSDVLFNSHSVDQTSAKRTFLRARPCEGLIRFCRIGPPSRHLAAALVTQLQRECDYCINPELKKNVTRC